MKTLQVTTVGVIIFFLVNTQIYATEIVPWREIAANKDCGVNCLVIACKLLGKTADKQEISTLAKLSVDGTNISNLADAAIKKGLFCKGVKWDINKLKRWNKLAIAHWENHFVLVNGFDNSGKVYVIDPPQKPFTMAQEEFLEKWDGKVLLISDSPISSFVGFNYTYLVLAIITFVFGLLMLRYKFAFFMSSARKKILKPRTVMTSTLWLYFFGVCIGPSQQYCWADTQINGKTKNTSKSTIKIVDNMDPLHEVDFGRVQQNKKLNHTIYVINETNKPLKIKGVSTSCSCTAAIISKKQIQPRETAQIKITFDTKEMYGKTYKPFLIRFEDSGLKTIKVDLNVFIYIPSARFTIDSLYFDSIPVGKGAIQKFYIVNKNDPESDWEIDEMETSSSLINVLYIPNRGEIICELSKDAPKGPLNEKIIIFTKEKSGIVPIEIPVLGEVNDDIKISPEKLHLGTLKKEASVKRYFKVTQTGKDEPICVEEIKGDVKVEVNLERQNEKERLFYAKFYSPKETGLFQGKIVLKIGSTQKINIPYAGFVLD